MFKALLKVQQTVGAIRKDAVNPFHKNRYASLGAILEVLLPALHENGFVLMQPIERDGDIFGVRTYLLWTGDKMSERIDCGFIPLLECKDPQAQGKAISYNRRYALQTALGLWADDDDAESVVRPVAPKFDSKGAKVTPKVTPSVTEVQAKQEPVQTKGTDAIIPIPHLESVAPPPVADKSNNQLTPFSYSDNAHRQLLTKAVKSAAVHPSKLSVVREVFESGKWSSLGLVADLGILTEKIKEIANG